MELLSMARITEGRQLMDKNKTLADRLGIPQGVLEAAHKTLDPVNKKELKGKHKDRKDKDIDNDGDVDSTDKYLHKRRKAISKAVDETKGAPKGYHFTRSGKLRKGDAGADGPGGKKLRSDPLDKQRSKIPPLPENKIVDETKSAPKGYHFTRDGKLKKGDADADGDGGKKLRSDPLDKQRSKIPPLPEKVEIPEPEEKKVKKIVKSLKKSVKGHDAQQKTLQKLLDKDDMNELTNKALSNYMRKSSASVSGSDARTQDKRVAGQKMADDKMRKAAGKSSTARVGASESTMHEGTWALPETPREKAELKKLMSRKIELGEMGALAADKLYGLIGDDELFDNIYVAGKRNPKGDARPIIKKFIKDRRDLNIQMEQTTYNVSIRGQGGTQVKAKTPKHAASKAFRKMGIAQRHRSSLQHTVKPHNEGAMSRMATQDAERKRLGPNKVKGSGMDTFKPKPKPKTGARLLDVRARMAGIRDDVNEATDLYNKGGIQITRFSMGKGKGLGVQLNVGRKNVQMTANEFKNLQRALPRINVNQGLRENVDEDSAADVLKRRYASNRPEDNPQATKRVADAKPGVKTHKLHPNMDFTSKGTYSKKGKMAALKKQHARRPEQYGITREETVDEARRGRPPKSGVHKTDDMESGKHIVVQLRKAVSLRGNHHVEFKDGKKHKISVQHANRALNTHSRLRTPAEKKAFQDKLHKSHDSFQNALKDKNPGQGPQKRGITLPGSKRIGGSF